MQTIRTYEFYPPDVIEFSDFITSAMLLDLDIEHVDPTTIHSDMYHRLFKKFALRDVLDNLIMVRSKYTSLSTPIGQIELNIDVLTQMRDKLNDELQQAEENLPPEQIITFL